MAYPGTYNITYYRGDTLEFRIYPKDNSGLAINLSGYTPLFTISTARGDAGLLDQLPGYIDIENSNESLLCAITPDIGEQLVAGTTYVYDIEISKSAIDADSPYDLVNTLLTGTISVNEQVGVSDFGAS